jgi:hypothetical protein
VVHLRPLGDQLGHGLAGIGLVVELVAGVGDQDTDVKFWVLLDVALPSREGAVIALLSEEDATELVKAGW